jgi:transposase InsO family protein
VRFLRAGYYAHRQKPERPRRLHDQKLAAQITPIFQQSRHTYGSPRIHAALRRAGERCGKNRVARLMRQQGLRAKQKRRFRPQTPQSRHALPVAENGLAKVPPPTRPDQIWVSDITYLPTTQGWLYLAVILDACSRKVVGWQVEDHLEIFFGDRSPETSPAAPWPRPRTPAPFGSGRSIGQ